MGLLGQNLGGPGASVALTGALQYIASLAFPVINDVYSDQSHLEIGNVLVHPWTISHRRRVEEDNIIPVFYSRVLSYNWVDII